MRIFQLDGEPERLYFTNYDRIDEDIFFQQVFVKLKHCPDVKIGKKTIGPSEDLYACKILSFPFVLIYDINYGTSILAKNAEAIKNLKNIFEEI